MASNAVHFSAELEKEYKLFTARGYRNFRDKLLYDAMATIDETWPVDSGYSRASNLPFVDTPLGSASVPEPDKKEYPKGAAKPPPDRTDQMQLVLGGSDPFDTVGIATNVIYAVPLEHGHSNQNSLMYTRAAQAIANVVESAEEYT